MTSPEDDDLEQALRRALSGEADKVEPGADGLDKIRARIDGRPPRPWLVSVVFGVLDRVRNWTWHGHWAWQESLPRPGALWGRRSRRSNFPRWDIKWLRLVTALAGVAVLAGVALGVQPVRQAILQASTSLNGGGGPTRGSAGTEGDGTQASGGNGAPTASGAAPGGGQPSQGSTATVTGKSQSATPHSASTARCVATALPVVTAAEPSPTSAIPDASGTAPTTKVTSPATSSPASPTQPNYTATDVPTCPVGSPTSSPTPTPTSAPSSPAPTPTDVSQTPVTAPSDSDPSQDPAPAPTPTPTPTASTRWPTKNYPSDSPSSHGTGRDSRATRHVELDVWRAHRR
jgi:hypothetical protein